jgi:hypothetical protein
VSPTPLNPEVFYQVARDLAARGRDEGEWRTAIGRAYYACYHLARLGCRRKWSWSPPEQGRHRAVVRKLRQHHQHYLADHLSQLLNLREHADYDLDTPVDRALCDGALALAAALVPRLRSL